MTDDAPRTPIPAPAKGAGEDPRPAPGAPEPTAVFRGARKFSLNGFVGDNAPAEAKSRAIGRRHVVASLAGRARPVDLMDEDTPEAAPPPPSEPQVPAEPRPQSEPQPPTTAAAAQWRAKIVTLFPEAFPGVLGLSLTGKALEAGIWALETIDLRPFGVGRHLNVDDTPAGGGAGMVLRPDVVAAALDRAREGAPADRADWPVIYMSPRGRPFTQADAQRLSKARGMTILCGRFEGVDERVLEAYGVEEISIGDFVLTGGELAAQVLIDATVRLIPRVLGNQASTEEESFSDGLLEHPQYTRPTLWEGRAIPDVLQSGHHAKIEAWKRVMAERLTKERRPDLWRAHCAKRGVDPDED